MSVVDMRRAVDRAPAPDDVFFTKEQIHLGRWLTHYGRRDPGSPWLVVNIQSRFTTKTVGKYVVRNVDEVRHLNDTLTIENKASGERRRLTFSYMSYSAIWRLG